MASFTLLSPSVKEAGIPAAGVVELIGHNSAQLTEHYPTSARKR